MPQIFMWVQHHYVTCDAQFNVQSGVTTLELNPMKSTFDHIVYSTIDGRCRLLLVGTWGACVAYVSDNPRGPFGGSTHIRPRAA